MSRRESATAVCAAAALLLMVGCSRVPPGGATVTAGGGPGGGLQPGSVTGTPGAGGAGAPGGGVTGPGGSVSGPGGTAGGTGLGTGSGTGSGTGTGAGTGSGTGSGDGGASGLSGPGIKGHTIHVVFHAKLNDCGPDPQSAKSGTLAAKGYKTYADYVKYFNSYILGPYGWKLTYELIDDGGQYCPEVARAAALKIIKEIKPFAVLGDSTNGDAGSVLADIVTSAHYLNIGLSWQTFDEFKKRNPYAWSIFSIAQQQDQYLAEWIGSRVKGTPGSNPTTGAAEPRVFGMLTVDNAENHKLASLLKANLASRGVTLTHEYFVSSDPGVAAQSATNTVLKMKNDGVNTLIFAIPYTSLSSLLVHTSAMGNQGYTPDLLGSRYGVVFFDELIDQRVWAHFRGIFNGSPALMRASGTNQKYLDINENGAAYKYAWNQEGNTDDADNQGNTPNVWATLSVLGEGILNAGPVLNAQTFANGMDLTSHGAVAECMSWRLFGRPWTYGIYDSQNQQHEGAVYGYDDGYWVKKKNDFGTVGYYESYDSYRYFIGGDLPNKATGDTGGTASPDIPKQPRIGVLANKSCVPLGYRD